MAKKSVKKPSKKAAKQTTKKASKNATKKTSKPAAKRDPLAPVPVKTGPGATPMELGAKLVADFNNGKMHLTDAWSKDIVSIEGLGTSMAWHGRQGVDAKNAWWMSDHVVHGARAEGPYVGATGFGVKFEMDVETKSTGKREKIVEIGVYTVKNGKIVQEEFMYFGG
ncbi:MAG: nuclear transport factor 2 family protein [Phycisphaerales bacterium]|nr:nuclear transport factor 2 family protein [Phycisphaerales bacterium]